jgi:peptidoglycan/xylan/chitin deacetylase (PgdA/CDA1 family)
MLLYHRLSPVGHGTRYTIGVDAFEAQLVYLVSRGYRAITISQLTDLIRVGGRMAGRPVVITFDDGNGSVYEYAFPSMKAHGMPGVVYVVANRLEADGYLDVPQLKELAAAGWEIGSHSMSHVDLTAVEPEHLRREILYSRLDLERELGFAVRTFAYPFGQVSPAIAQKVFEYGYYSAVGLGLTTIHDRGSIYYLQRREVWGNMDLEQFEALLHSGP